MGGSESRNLPVTGELSPGLSSIINENDVVIFSWRTCPYCIKAKSLLDEKKITYVDIIASESQTNELYQATGQSSVPSIWVKGTFIGGCNDGPESWMGLAPCLRSGKFNELLNK
jgi:glutaredoxin 3